MNIYTLLEDPRVMGEEDPKYGWTFWANKVEEIDLPVMFNSKTGNVLRGDRLAAEEQERKTSAKGTEYLRLKRVKISGSQEAGPHIPEPQSIKAQLPAAADLPKDREYQVTRNMTWKNLLNHFDVQSMEPDSEQWQRFWGLVDLHTERLMQTGQSSGSQSGGDISPKTIKEAKSQPAAEPELKGLEKARAMSDSIRRKPMDTAEANDFLKTMEEPPLSDEDFYED